MFVPWVSLAVAFMIPKIKRRVLDNKDPYHTKKTSMAKFKMIWAGKDYIIHFKYSAFINQIFITMFYGVGMPVLFPICAGNLFTYWCVERFIVAWMSV